MVDKDKKRIELALLKGKKWDFSRQNLQQKLTRFVTK
jgi:hypothetical protein